MAEHCPACGHKLAPDTLLSWGGYELDEAARAVYSGGETCRLTPQETDLFASLMRARGRVSSREYLMGSLFGHKPECDQPEIKILDILVHRVRKKIPLAKIQTIWGHGYRLRVLS